MTALEKLETHIAGCNTCTAAKKRVNDFCRIGRVLFLDWVRGTGQKPVSVRELSEEESRPILAAAEKERQKAKNN